MDITGDTVNVSDSVDTRVIVVSGVIDTSGVLEIECIDVRVGDTSAEEDGEGKSDGVVETRELLETVPAELIVEACVAEYVSTGEADTIGV